jgi:hypothetical protein
LAELLEGFLWLDLGVDLDIFPLTEARSLCSQRVSHISDVSIDLLASWGHLFDADVRDVLRAFVTGKSFVGEGRLGTFDSASHLRSDFNTSNTMHRRFVSDENVQFFLLNANFNPEFSSLRLGKDLDDYTRLSERERLVIARTFEGFAETLAYMNDFRQFMLDLRDRISEKDRRLFSQRVQEIQKWRINCGTSPLKEIFELLARRFSNHVTTIVPGLDDLLSPGSLVPQIKLLMGDWGYPMASAAG